jgi:hypothetical protein
MPNEKKKARSRNPNPEEVERHRSGKSTIIWGFKQFKGNRLTKIVTPGG